MTKIDIVSGFLGAGKTTLIKKLISESFKGEKVVLIENEFGEIGIDGGFLQEAGIEITEMNSGCICCSLVGDFSEALKKVLDEYTPDRIVIEPSGVGKLSDVIRAVESIDAKNAVLSGFTTVADATKCRMYMKNFGEFYNDQIANAGCIVLSHTDKLSDEKISACVELIRQHNESATVVTTVWDELTGPQLLGAMERKDTLADDLKKLREEEVCPECGHHHHHEHHDHDHDHDCHEHHHHDHDHDCDCHEHHHHDHDHDCDCHEHHHHDHDHDCDCHEHHHHHADDVFTSWGRETTNKYSADEITEILKKLENEAEFGMVLRAKGIVAGKGSNWIHFDYVPGEPDVREGSAGVIGRLCVIGSDIKEEKIAALFNV